MPIPYKDTAPYSSFSDYGLQGSDYMPDWLQPTTMSYQSPSIAKDIGQYGMRTTGTSATPNYLYQQQYGGSAMNSGGSRWDNRSWSQLGTMDKLSAVGQGVSAFATLAGIYTGFKGLQQQKKQFKFTKSAWNKNFTAQLGAYDNALRDNYQRYAQGNQYFGNEYQPEDEYMAQRSLSHLAG